MLRLALLLLLSTSVNSIYQGTPTEVATKINNRMKVLFNADFIPQLVQEVRYRNPLFL